MNYQSATHLRCFMFVLGAVFARTPEEAERFARENGLTGPQAMEVHQELLDDMFIAREGEGQMSHPMDRLMATAALTEMDPGFRPGNACRPVQAGHRPIAGLLDRVRPGHRVGIRLCRDLAEAGEAVMIKHAQPVRDQYRTHRSAITMTVSSGGKRQQRRQFPVTSITPHPHAWSLALILADGDIYRLRAQPDGSVIVAN